MRWWLKLGLVVVAVALGLTAAFTSQNIRPNIGTVGLKSYNKGFAYPETLISAFTPGPVQDDLEERGFVSIDSVPNDSTISVIDAKDIEGLIQSGIYFLNPSNRLELGPISIPAQVQQLQGNATYRYAQRRTQMWGFLDNFAYIGLDINVSIPANVGITSGSKTSHNLYCIHLTLTDGRWVESGVGWVTWTTSPIIYTYQSYTGKWSVTEIPGGTQRDINLKIQIGPDKIAELYAFDHQSNKSVKTRQEVGGLGHVADFAQEQHSKTNQWTDTDTARFHNAKLMRMEIDQWVDWDSSITSTWIQNPPMIIQRGESGEQGWTETWCETK